MVVIRLSRSGAKKRPFFNIVVTESRHRRDGRFNERIGFYNPMIAEGPQRLTFSADRLAYWGGKGRDHERHGGPHRQDGEEGCSRCCLIF